MSGAEAATGLEDRVAIAIPAYQAEPSVGDVVRRCLQQLPQVLVVDDGSDDRTAAEARGAGAEVLSFEVNRGKGDALEVAFAELFGRGFSSVVTVDADGQHLPEEIPKLLAVVDEADLVLGTRDHLYEQMSRVRRTSNRLSSRAISWAAGEPLTDIQTGFRIYSKRLIETVGFPEPRFQAESAVVVRAARCGFRIVGVPVHLGFADGRTTSHYRPLIDSLRIAVAVTRARFDWKRPRRPRALTSPGSIRSLPETLKPPRRSKAGGGSYASGSSPDQGDSDRTPESRRDDPGNDRR